MRPKRKSTIKTCQHVTTKKKVRRTDNEQLNNKHCDESVRKEITTAIAIHYLLPLWLTTMFCVYFFTLGSTQRK
jgi:hypothetical protein